MPFLLKDFKEKEYFLSITFKGREYRYIAKMYYYQSGVETWYVKARGDQLLTFYYNISEKKLTQFFIQPDQKKVPEDFMAVLQKEFDERK